MSIDWRKRYKIPLILAGIAGLLNILSWITMTLIGRVGLGLGRFPENSQLALDSLLKLWNITCAPITKIFLPYLVRHVPIQGGGFFGVFVETAYVLLCSLWVAVVVFIIAALVRYSMDVIFK